MTSLDAIGISHQAAGPRAQAAPVTRAREPGSEKPVDKGERPATRSQSQRVELPTRSFQARLNYDHKAEEVVVEILNPSTGDVLQRIPAENVTDNLRLLVANSGPLIQTYA